MNRQTRTLIVLVVALAAAGVASFGVYQAISSRPVVQVEMPTRYAVVAAAPMPLGTLLTRDSVKLVAWPERTPIQGGFDTIEAVLDRGLIAPVVENEPITEHKLAPKEAGAGLPPTIQTGMRALSVRVNEVIGVAGFVVPGTRVDVVAIISPEGNRENTISRVVVSNVQVLTAGTRYDQQEGREGNAVRSTVVTLMVTPEDAEKIALAQSEGQLVLTLRNPLDVEPTTTTGVRRAGLFSGQAPAAPAQSGTPRPAARRAAAPPPPPPPPSRIYTVETIRAAKRSEEVVR